MPPGVRCKRAARKAAKGVLVRRTRKAKDKDHFLKESPPAGGVAAGLKSPRADPGRTAGEAALASGLAASSGGAACDELRDVGRQKPGDKLRPGASAGSRESPGGPHRAAKRLRARGASKVKGEAPSFTRALGASRSASCKTKGPLQATVLPAWEAVGTEACEEVASVPPGRQASWAEPHPPLPSDEPL